MASGKTTRGASASRSSFRAAKKSTAKARVKPPKRSAATPAKTSAAKLAKPSAKAKARAKAKTPAKKPTTKPAAKPTKKPRARVDSSATFTIEEIAARWPSILPASSDPLPQGLGSTSLPPTESRSADSTARSPAEALSSETATTAQSPSGIELIGQVTAPSGELCIFDVGLVPYLPRPALEPAMIIAKVPSDRSLSVVGRRVGRGRFASCWDHVAITLGDGDIARSRKLGSAGVDFARLICIDKAALDHWQHDDSLDGQADFVFWGRDAGKLAKAMRASTAAEGYGWTNLPVAEAESRADRAAQLKADNKWLLAMDLRPHSHHFQMLAAARATKSGAGTIQVGGASVCLFFTSWGDGVFPVFLDLDHDDKPVRIRIQLATDASHAAMHAVNP